MSQNNIVGDVYDGLALYGRMESIFYLILSFIFGLSLIIYGVLTFFSKWKKISATILSKELIKDEYKLKLQYSVNQIEYINFITVSPASISGDKINISYNPKNPNEIMYLGVSNQAFGGFMIFFGILLFAGGYFNYYLTKNFKGYAAFEGANNFF